MDIEGNGLLQEITKVWCIVAQDMDTDEVFVYHNFPQFDYARVQDNFDNKEYIIPKRNGNLAEGIDFISEASELNCHNIFGYDYFVMKKFFPKFSFPLRNIVDTLILSKLQWYDRPTPKGCKGPHGLAAWANRLGMHKPDVTDWSIMDAFKLHRCIEDVSAQAGAYRLLQKERQKLEETVGASMDEAIAIEHRYRYEATLQELDGAPVDVPHMKACVEELDTLCAELREEIEPKLPMTLKIKAVRATGHEVATLLGAKKVPPIRYEMNGENRVEVKEYYKPTTNWLTMDEENLYAAVNEVLGIDTGAMFNKMKEARDYAKKHFEENQELYAEDLETGKKLKKPKMTGWKYPKESFQSVMYNSHICRHFGVEPTDYEKHGKMIDGPFTRIEWSKSTMSQHGIVKDFLLSLGWKPTSWNYKKDSKGQFERDEKRNLIKTTPKLTEDSFSSLPEGVGKQIADYNTYSHRRKFIENPADGEKGLLNNVREDGRISCGINSFGTSSGRSSHSIWVNPAGVGALYGEKIRKIIRATDENFRLVGADMKSAQLSIAAYYANNYDYYKAVADGQELDEEGKYIGLSGHCYNARAFGLVSEEEWKRAVETQDEELLHSIMLRRKLSKGGTFACVPTKTSKVLTKTGWKGYNEISVGEEIMTYNTETGINEYAPIEAIHYFEDKPIIRMGNKEWSVDSTEDHRWFVKRRTGKRRTRREVSEFITTKDIKSECKIITSAKFVGNKESLLTEDEARLLAWILSDGTYQWTKKSTCKAVLVQSENKYIAEVERLLTNIQGSFLKRLQSDSSVKNPCYQYSITAKVFKALWSKCEFPSFTKKENLDIEKVILKLGNKELEAFLEAFIQADGTFHNTRGNVVYQNEGAVLDAVKLCATLLGYSLSESVKKTDYPTKHICKTLTLRKKSHIGSTNFVKEFLPVEPTFCVTTRNSTFLMKQGEVITITGNCLFGASGKKIATTIGINEREGEAAKQRFLGSIGLDEPIARLVKMMHKNKRGNGGYIEVPFGYWVYCSQEHKLFNYIDQASEAACQKVAEIHFKDWLTKETKSGNVQATKILSYHDEHLCESHVDCVDEVGKAMSESYTYAAERMMEWHQTKSQWFRDLTFSIDLNGGYKVGYDYLDCH